MTARDDIERTIKQFFHSMDTQNYELMKKLIAPRADMVHIGTDKDEIWQGWSELKEATKEQFDNLEYYKADIYDLEISIADSGHIAWYYHRLDARIKSNGKEHSWKGARFTGVLVQKGKEWQIVQSHVSIPETE